MFYCIIYVLCKYYFTNYIYVVYIDGVRMYIIYTNLFSEDHYLFKNINNNIYIY